MLSHALMTSSLFLLDGCPPGMHVSETAGGEIFCRWCRSGTYQPEENTAARECIPCKKGMVSSQIGATSARACQNCPSGSYATGQTTCTPCPLNTISPSGASDVSECTPLAGHYAGSPGVAAIECPANFYCVEGTTAPTQCPDGTISPPGTSRCTPGVRSVILYDWVFGVAWLVLFSSGVFGLGVYRHALKNVGGGARNSAAIQIKIVQ
jgi:hypothetical protein